jgi:hypothetical protein
MMLASRRRGAFALGLLCSLAATSCISKGDTNVTSNGNNVQREDAEDSGAPTAVTSLADDESSSESPIEDTATTDEKTTASGESAAASSSATDTDDSESISEETAAADSSAEPDSIAEEQSDSEETDVGGDTSQTDTGSDEPDAAAVEPEVETERCSLTSGRPALGEAELLTKNDIADKLAFYVAAGPSEHLVTWTSGSALRFFQFNEEGRSKEITSLPLEPLGALLPGVAAVYSAEAKAYAVTWKELTSGNTNNIAFNWIKAGIWTEEEAIRFGDGQRTDWGQAIGLAYDGNHYAIGPNAEHPYAVIVNQLGTGTMQGPSGTPFTRVQSRDIVSIGGDKFATVGHYNDGEVGTFWDALGVFNADTGESNVYNVSPGPSLEGLVGQANPRNTQLAWVGEALAVSFGDGAALRYALLSTQGETPFSLALSNESPTPLDLYFDPEDSITYILSTDGQGVYFMGVDALSGDVVVPNRGIAKGEDVSDGFLLWDEAAGRHRIYFSSKVGNLHQIYTSSVGCEVPN